MRTIFSHFEMTKAQRSGFFVLLGLIFLAQIVIFLLNRNQKQPEKQPIPQELVALQEQIDSLNTQENSNNNFAESVDLKPFNPNALDKNGWMELGFSEKQAETWIKYKYSLGGNFTTLQQIKECFILSEEKYNQLLPYIQLANVKVENQSFTKNSYQNFDKKEKSIKPLNLKKFNPNKLDEKGWINLGFSEKQVASILKYKFSLGGKFTSLEQIKSCFVISEEKFNQLKPYIIFDKIETETKISEKINPNQLTLQQWKTLGFSEKEAKGILEFKNFIGGKFSSKEDVKNCQFISDEQFQKIESKLIFE